MVDSGTLKKLDILVYSYAKMSKIYGDGVKSVLFEIEEFAKKQILLMENASQENINKLNVVINKLLEVLEDANNTKNDLESIKNSFILEIKSLIDNFKNSEDNMMKLIKENRSKIKRRIYG